MQSRVIRYEPDVVTPGLLGLRVWGKNSWKGRQLWKHGETGNRQALDTGRSKTCLELVRQALSTARSVSHSSSIDPAAGMAIGGLDGQPRGGRARGCVPCVPAWCEDSTDEDCAAKGAGRVPRAPTTAKLDPQTKYVSRPRLKALTTGRALLGQDMHVNHGT